MAGTKWDFETGVVAVSVGAMFAGKDARPPENPFDQREKIPPTEEEKAELAAAKERIEELKRQAFHKAQEQHGTR